MTPFPFDELIAPILIALGGAVVFPRIALWVAGAMVSDDASEATDEHAAALGAALPGTLAAVGILSWGSIGPVWASSPWVSLAVVVPLLALVAVQLRRARRHGPVVARTGGFVIGLFALVLVLIVGRVTDVHSIPEADEGAAWWNLRLDPWDADAVLALAWAAERRDDLDLAQSRMELAARLGVSEAERLTLAAAIASRDDCDAARTHFDAALAARAQDAIDSGESLELGGYFLPEELVRRCEMAE